MQYPCFIYRILTGELFGFNLCGSEVGTENRTHLTGPSNSIIVIYKSKSCKEERLNC